VEAATRDVRSPGKPPRVIHVEQTPAQAVPQAGRRIALSLPVGADKNVLRRPVNAIFPQKGAQFLLPPRGQVCAGRRSPRMGNRAGHRVGQGVGHARRSATCDHP
jgi:hypothetical protein